MPKKMLINTAPGQECRIAVVSEDGLEELYVERTSAASRVGNVYKARVTNVEAAIQAAFVDIGLGKNGFLHISDVNPTYFPKNKRAVESVGQKRSHHYRPPIQECLRRGQEVVVQMIKEGIGTKGPTMTTYLSIPGRLLVMMPGMTKLGVSRKVEDEEARDKARDALNELTLPPDMGFIVRTAGIGRPKRELQRDLNYLLRLWKAVKQQIKKARTPSEIYQESDLVTRTIRDVYNAEIERIICDRDDVARQVEQFLSVAVPRSKHTVELYTGKEGLFHEAGLEIEIEKINARRVELPMGGSLIFDQAEALVAIDVNSGRFRQHSDAETTALKINLQAATEIARQLRLRDLGGVIVIDFIDMREQKNRRLLEKTLKDALKPDRAKTKVLRTSSFGIIELTRQRLGPSLKQSYFNRCACCDGLGVVQSEESLSLKVMRDLQRASADENVSHIEAVVPPEVAHFLVNSQRLQIARIETETGKTVVIRADSGVGAGNSTVECTNVRGAPVSWDHPVVGKTRQQGLPTMPIAEVPLPERLGGEKSADASTGSGTLAATPADQPGHGVVDFDVIEAADQADYDEQDAAIDRAISETDDRAAQEQAAAAAHAVTGEGPAVPGKRKRRGRRGGRKHRRHREKAAEGAQDHGEQPKPEQRQEDMQQPQKPEQARPAEGEAPQAGEEDAPKKKRRRRRRRKPHTGEEQAARQDQQAQPAEGSQEPAEPKAQPRPESEAKPAEKQDAQPAPAETKPEPKEKAEAKVEPQAAPAKAETKSEVEAKPKDAADEKPAPAKPKRARRKRTTKKTAAKSTEKAEDKPAGEPKMTTAAKASAKTAKPAAAPEAGKKSDQAEEPKPAKAEKSAAESAAETPAKPKRARRKRTTKKTVKKTAAKKEDTGNQPKETPADAGESKSEQ